MGNKPRPVTIESFKTAQGKIDFKMLEGTKETDTLVFNKTKDKMKKDESYDIKFTLVNTDGLQLQFKQDLQEVMWVAKGNKTSPPGCPNNRVSDPEFTVTAVTATTLDVTNTDKDECKFKFVLNFIDTASNNKAVQFDPIYDNQNGGFQRSPTVSTSAIVGGLAVAGAVVVIVVAMDQMGWLG